MANPSKLKSISEWKMNLEEQMKQMVEYDKVPLNKFQLAFMEKSIEEESVIQDYLSYAHDFESSNSFSFLSMTQEQKVELLKSRHAIAFRALHGYEMQVAPRTFLDNRAVVMMDSDNGRRTIFASIAECSAFTGKPKDVLYKILKKRLKNIARMRFSYA